jgi:hypothetical protein
MIANTSITIFDIIVPESPDLSLKLSIYKIIWTMISTNIQIAQIRKENIAHFLRLSVLEMLVTRNTKNIFSSKVITGGRGSPIPMYTWKKK